MRRNRISQLEARANQRELQHLKTWLRGGDWRMACGTTRAPIQPLSLGPGAEAAIRTAQSLGSLTFIDAQGQLHFLKP